MGFGLRQAGTTGFWGEPTSTLDWCEENYVVTKYIAEFWNSTSNALYILFMFVGLFSAARLGVTEWRVYLSLYSIAIVGVGSFLFHATLWYETQMMDELPMIYGSCIFVYANLRVFPETNKNNGLLSAALAAYSIIVTVLYLYVKNPVFHEVCYGLLVAILLLLPPWQIYYFKEKYPQYAAKIPGLWKLFWYAAVSYLSGFAIWGIDNNYCEVLRGARAQVGYPWRIALEFHLFWHLGTAVGTYASVMMLTYFRLLAIGRDDVYLKWLNGIFPIITTSLSDVQVRKLKKKAEKSL
ncbi:ceramidase [Chytriomyces sp. MP71]|nr:ceramidase [Chytriomyces sp. MP71]